MSHGAQRLLRVERNTRDLDRAVAFYCDALGFRVDDAHAPAPIWTQLPGVGARPARCARLVLGAQTITLSEYPGAAPYPEDTLACDLGFQHCAVAVSDVAAAHACVMQHAAVPISEGAPQRLPPSTGCVLCFKFRDPDAHPLELIQFPPAVGDPAWQRASGDPTLPTLGIGHTAISVADVERSAKFYTLLGLHVITRGVNHGVEQQRLDDVPNPEVDVIALESAQARTPHLELLGYRRPRGRADRSVDPTSIAADRMVWHAESIDVLLDALDEAGFSDSVVASGFVDGATVALLRDPDGHLLVLTEGKA